MTEKRTPEELLEIERIQNEKEHDHHHPTAAAMTNHIISNQAVLHVKLHQYHWYIKGPHFFALHEILEELYNDNNRYYDDIAEQLIASGAKPASTMEEYLKYSLVAESAEDKYLPAEKMIENLVADFRITRDLAGRTIHLAQNEENSVLEDLIIEYKGYLDKTIWMLQAFLNKSALEGEDDE
ncbi:Dps family protein [Marinilactibacillus piezotolerans]|uniref:Dps family protein n=1 Tax=Marinilactibacillus piezotolerans TaxID=258723 RepID=UPI0009AF2FCF|nr:DNA starvation/stationary phase protection protein [Marinilactibacillus piezotolerans]